MSRLLVAGGCQFNDVYVPSTLVYIVYAAAKACTYNPLGGLPPTSFSSQSLVQLLPGIQIECRMQPTCSLIPQDEARRQGGSLALKAIGCDRSEACM